MTNSGALSSTALITSHHISNGRTDELRAGPIRFFHSSDNCWYFDTHTE